MEILIPGLILVALMVYASTKIKKRAAEAFEPEMIETDAYALRKPEGFLHVIGDTGHEFNAHTKDFGEGDGFQERRATIELDIITNAAVQDVCDSIRDAAFRFDEKNGSSTETCRIESTESATGTTVSAFYKIVGARDAVYRLRFATLPEYTEEYLRRIDETLDSFVVKTS